MAVSPEELHFACWRAYKEAIEKSHPETFGEVALFDLATLDRAKWLIMLSQAGAFLKERDQLTSESLQARINATSNDYSRLSSMFEGLTGRALDDTRPLPPHLEFPGTSVVIPYYNARSTIFDVLESIACQRLTPEEFGRLQVVVVDDGWNDGIDDDVAKKRYPFEVKVVTC